MPDILEHKSVMWHGESRRWCTMQKSCDLADKKRISAETQDNDEHDNVSVAAVTKYLTRLML